MIKQLPPLITKEAIELRVIALAKLIEKKYLSDQSLLMIGTLKGSFIFLADLVRAMNIDVEIDFISISSYREHSSSGSINIKKDIDTDIKGRSVIIVEDIIDTGNTISHLVTMLKDRGAKSIEVCSLLDKPSRRTTAVTADYVGFEIEDLFVIGYGLDYAQYGRSLPYIAVVNTND